MRRIIASTPDLLVLISVADDGDYPLPERPESQPSNSVSN
jgi:hypothetical protein